MRYNNVDAAIDFLCRAFGFELRSKETDANGKACYAELSFGDTIIMIAAASGFDLDRFMTQPGDIGGAETQCCYYVVDDIDAHYARARNAGCEIVIDMQTRPNGARAFTCRDPEGHLWCFGTYDPWRSLSIAPDRPDAGSESEVLSSDAAAGALHAAPKFPARLAAGLSIGAVVSGLVAVWMYGEAWQTAREATAAPTAAIGPERVVNIEVGKEAFQRAIKDARLHLAFERRARRAAERASKAAQAKAARERSQRIAAEETAKQLSERLVQAQHAADVAQKAASAAQNDLAREQQASKDERIRLASAAEEAQRAAADARSELAGAEAAKAAAEQETKKTRARLTFVSLNARKESQAAIAKLRKQLQDETAAREVAEREAEDARADLARERRLKLAAWSTVEQLKRRLAAAGVKVNYGQARPKKAARSKTQAAGRPTSTPANTASARKGWSLYSGPVFVKEAGSP